MENLANNDQQVKQIIIMFDFPSREFGVIVELTDSTIMPLDGSQYFNPEDIFSFISPRRYEIPPTGERVVKCHHCYPGIDDKALPEEIEPLTVRYKTSFLKDNQFPDFVTITGLIFYKRTVTAPTLKHKDIEQIHLIGFLTDPPKNSLPQTAGSHPHTYSPHSGKVYLDTPHHLPEKKKAKVIQFKPKLKKQAAPPRLKLYRIPQHFYNSKSFEDMPRGAIELYRIIRTFSDPPEGKRNYHYNQIGLAQLSKLMKQRREDLLASCRKENRAEIEKIRTSIRPIGRYKDKLCKRGLLYQVVTGKHNVKFNRPSYNSKYLVVVSEKQRFKLMAERKGIKKPRS